jgi:nifR3 family TIM-barrel protein
MSDVAHPDEFSPLSLGSLRVWPPVVLAPMAGVTNLPFRKLCRRFGAALCMSEMIAARALVEGHARTLLLSSFGDDETPRSLQLYGSDPNVMAEAVRRLVAEGRVDHLDLNFGCPVRKVTRKGGGAAIPAKPRLLESIIRAAVREADSIPVTIKVRIGIDDRLSTFLTAGRVAQAAGCAGVGLHARTAAQLYSGAARWDAIAELKQAIGIPVLGNGDVWEAQDALFMMRRTGCDAVIIGRGCLGRPWLFRDMSDVFAGRETAPAPNLGQVVAIMLEHAAELSAWMGEPAALRAFRRHATWYTKGFRGSARQRQRLMQVRTLAELEAVLRSSDLGQEYPHGAARLARAKSGRCQQVSLPEGFWDDPEDPNPPDDSEEAAGG